jgi:hypothetical protein
MAEIEFKRRGTPLWVVLLLLFVLAAAGFFAYRVFGPGTGPPSMAPGSSSPTATSTPGTTAPGAGPATPAPR